MTKRFVITRRVAYHPVRRKSPEGLTYLHNFYYPQYNDPVATAVALKQKGCFFDLRDTEHDRCIVMSMGWRNVKQLVAKCKELNTAHGEGQLKHLKRGQKDAPPVEGKGSFLDQMKVVEEEFMSGIRKRGDE